ncbi:PLD nuclease N-terminal domain-containing protein [Pengzhenrongella sp.]|jgi:hypothetical protein|uniref:PLD nuclease N-terminal domain-containing protein n=1 Tax=Pengzhenrongella sp. TaxID=2888820 RepID=UPI002F9252B3
MRNFGVLLLVGLVVYTVVDVTRSERAERFGIPQAIWIILILLFPLVGSVAWLALSRSARNHPDRPPRDGGGGAGRRSPSPAPKLGPDDDPEFLWRLEQRQREARRNNTAKPDPDDGGTDQDPAGPRGTTP